MPPPSVVFLRSLASLESTPDFVCTPGTQVSNATQRHVHYSPLYLYLRGVRRYTCIFLLLFSCIIYLFPKSVSLCSLSVSLHCLIVTASAMYLYLSLFMYLFLSSCLFVFLSYSFSFSVFVSVSVAAYISLALLPSFSPSLCLSFDTLEGCNVEK